MTTPNPNSDEIARVAHALWEGEGRPDGRDHEHWMRAIELIGEGSGEEVVAQNGGDARPQPGFEDAPPDVAPVASEDAAVQKKRRDGRSAQQANGAPG